MIHNEIVTIRTFKASFGRFVELYHWTVYGAFEHLSFLIITNSSNGLHRNFLVCLKIPSSSFFFFFFFSLFRFKTNPTLPNTFRH
jgi:hypothetical protein